MFLNKSENSDIVDRRQKIFKLKSIVYKEMV